MVALRTTGLTMRIGFVGAVFLAGGSGWLLIRGWHSRSTAEPFGEHGDVAFSGAVLLLCLLAVVAGAARAGNVSSRFLPLICVCLASVGPIFRLGVK